MSFYEYIALPQRVCVNRFDGAGNKQDQKREKYQNAKSFAIIDT
jgi:hypothetical protein